MILSDRLISAHLLENGSVSYPESKGEDAVFLTRISILGYL